MSGPIRAAVSAALVDRVPRDHLQPDSEFRRRRIVALVTLAIGATLLGFSLAARPGQVRFYVLTSVVAGVWVAGGFLSGPLHLGYVSFRGRLRRPLVTPIAIALVICALFVVGAVAVVDPIAPLRHAVRTVLDHADHGSLALVAVITVLNGVAEEIFFRGAVYAAAGRRYPVLVTTITYCAATVATGNVMLVFAAATLGVILALERRASGGLLAPILTHVTWSLTMLFALPPLVT